MSKVQLLLKSAEKVLASNAPSILTGVGIAGMAATVIMASKATPKAIGLYEEALINKNAVKSENESEDEDTVVYDGDLPERLTPWETVKAVAPVYWPAAVMFLGSAVCFIFANKVNLRRQAALLAAYQLSETALSEYTDKVVEDLGEKTHQEIKEHLAGDQVKTNPPEEKSVIITGKGDVLCCDPWSKRYFRSTIENVKAAVNQVNNIMMREGEATLNDFYDYLDLESTEIGYSLGWDYQRMGQDLIELSLISQLTRENEPCAVIDFTTRPKWLRQYD